MNSMLLKSAYSSVLFYSHQKYEHGGSMKL